MSLRFRAGYTAVRLHFFGECCVAMMARYAAAENKIRGEDHDEAMEGIAKHHCR